NSTSVKKQQNGRKFSPGQYKARQRKKYSGDEVNHEARCDRQNSAPNPADLLRPEDAVKTLLEAGFLDRLHTCPLCSRRQLHGFVARPGCNPKQLYYKCDEWTCRAYTNVLQGGDSVAQSIMDALRELEASAGRAQRSRLTLTGQIEMDATVLRSFKVG
ncbi:unnamed protein product, partial [Effrenium voratum]